MSPHLLALVLAASPPPERAQQLAQQKAWEELYLAYATASPQDYPEPQRKTIAKPLLKGCEALVAGDAVMAYSLGERAVAFEETAPGLKCLARAALGSDQRGTAEEALRKGLERFPKEGAFGLELGKLLLEDKDGPGAVAALTRVPAGAPQAGLARQLLQKARGLASEASQARSQAEAIERQMNGEAPAGGGTLQHAVATGPGETQSTGYGSSLGADGMRTRINRRFVVKYFNNNRDFGQRADYEGRIVAALDEAYEHTRTMLGEARESPVDVVLYTREEFRTHRGEAWANVAAGLYADQAIRINDAAELTQRTKATLVHEYVHAALDEICGGGHQLPTWLNEGLAEYVEWRYLGSEGPPREVADMLQAAARGNKLPSLAKLSRDMLVRQANPALAYATSATAVRELIRRGGTSKLLTLVRDVGQGTRFDQALLTHYGLDVARLDEDVQFAASRR
ncbi:Peptidase MA superfamily protein [Stigmatella aurantiaca]|uniref:Peptidase MA superfamily protein n=1 Tax=Stigmatella aurantiaca TaxID=41 RepID=A0A1H7T209_STIAU|nr:peptidase MA family metallohydrolase [Stigmatella aurantiaca]SEL78843.1 Peptidase MA superfamily protein [Stigmatella aurantiaca]